MATDPRVRWIMVSSIATAVACMLAVGGYLAGWRSKVAEHAIREYAIDEHLEESAGVISEYRQTQKIVEQNEREIKTLSNGLIALVEAQKETNENLRALVGRVDALLGVRRHGEKEQGNRLTDEEFQRILRELRSVGDRR